MNYEKKRRKRIEVSAMERRLVNVPDERLGKPGDLVALLESLNVFDDDDARERFVVVTINTRNVPLRVDTTSVGTLNSSIVHPREILAVALETRAAGIFVAHNHPSGDPEPSRDDMAITRRLSQACDVMGIALIDHVVVATGARAVADGATKRAWRSFKDSGLL